MTKVVAFGAFVEILPGVEGLVHISELADHHVESPSEVVEPGTKLNVKILEIDEERRRLSLSIKQVAEGKMPMGDLGEQIEAAGEVEGVSDEGSDESAAGPVAEEDPSSSQAAGDDPSSTPPADEAAEAVEEPAAEVAEPAAEEELVEAPADEAESAEEPVAEAEAPAEEAAPEVEEPVAEAEPADEAESPEDSSES